MRIISGIFRSRVLVSPESDKVRPTSDRAKETLFNMLTSRIDFEGMTVYDLFCGTGNLGLESISRGALKCYFVDEDVKTVEKNTEILKVKDRSEVVRSEVLRFLNSHRTEVPDIIFCDPPYDYKNYPELTDRISRYNTIFVLEHSEKFKSDEKYSDQIMIKKKVGTVHFTVFDFNQ